MPGITQMKVFLKNEKEYLRKVLGFSQRVTPPAFDFSQFCLKQLSLRTDQQPGDRSAADLLVKGVK